MPSLQEIHDQYYSDMPFNDFAQKYHAKFYSDMPFDSFMQKSGGPPPSDPGKEMKPLSVLPFSVSQDGQDFKFDPNAGIVGVIKRAVTLPGDVATGKVDPKSPEGIQRATELAGVASPINPALRSGELATLFGGMHNVAPAPKVPTAADLKDAGRVGYAAARDMGVDIAPRPVNDMANGVIDSLNQDGLLAELAPTTHKIVSQLAEQQPAGSVAPFGGLVAARQALGRVARSIDPATRAPTQDAVAASRAVSALDKFMENPPAGSVLAGPADTAAATIKDANANWAAALRSNRLTDKADTAELRAAAANSGRNIGNTLRQRVTDILANPKLKSGYSDEEIQALTDIAKGTPTRNALRMVGNLLGGGGGLGAIVTGGVGGAAGAAVGGPLSAIAGAAIPAVGWASKSAENSLTRAAVEDAGNLIRQRSPLYRQAVDTATPDLQLSASGPATVRSGIVGALGADNAADAGAKFVNADKPSNFYSKFMQGMSDQDKADFSKGFASNLEKSILNADDRKGLVEKIFSSPKAKQQIEMALGADGARKFEAEMRQRYTKGTIL